MTTIKAALAPTRPLWDGYYINMDRDKQRRRQMEEQLRQFGFADRYQRFPAVDGTKLNSLSKRNKSEVGIFRSHMSILEKAVDKGRAVHVVEDDVVLCDLTASAIDAAVRNGVTDRFDILFLEFMSVENLGAMRYLHELYQKCTARRTITIGDPNQLQIIDIGGLCLYGLTSYVIGARQIDRVLSVLKEAWRFGPNLPVDTTLGHAIKSKRLSAASIFPFVTTIDLELSKASSAGRTEEPDNKLVQRLLRYSFFLRADIKDYAGPMMAAVAERYRPSDPQGVVELYTNVLRYYFTKPD